MRSIVDLVTDLATREHPALTWYGPDHERVDLTGKTAANWMIKAANLLSLELSSEPGTTIWLDLPAHWRSLVWAHAAWCTGARVSFTGDDADAAITASPGPAHRDLETVVIALPALARRVEDLPPDAIDGAADLMSQADAFVLPPAGGGNDPTGLGVSQIELISTSRSFAPAGQAPGEGARPPRVLLTGGALADLLGIVPSLWAQGASVVIADDSSVAGSEGVTHIEELATQ